MIAALLLSGVIVSAVNEAETDRAATNTVPAERGAAGGQELADAAASPAVQTSEPQNTGPVNDPVDEKVLTAIGWSCDDPDNDLQADWAGGSSPMPRLGDWIEVNDLDIARVEDTVVVAWELSSPIPNDVGSDPVLGDWIASWSVVLEDEASDYRVTIAVDKEGSQPVRLATELFDASAGQIYSLGELSGPARLEIDGHSMRITLPGDHLAFVGPTPIVVAAAEFSTPTTTDDEFEAWFYIDDVCSNDPSSPARRPWNIESVSLPTSALHPPVIPPEMPRPKELDGKEMCAPATPSSMWVDETCVDTWPFGRIHGGLLECRGFDVVFTAESQTYALNGNARKKDEYTDVVSVFRPGDGSKPGNVQDLINLAVSFQDCDIGG